MLKPSIQSSYCQQRQAKFLPALKNRVPFRHFHERFNRMEKSKKGGFILSILNGKIKRKFADSFYFAQAYEALATRRFATALEYSTFFATLPNGYENLAIFGEDVDEV